jgi:hypothetical protein
MYGICNMRPWVSPARGDEKRWLTKRMWGNTHRTPEPELLGGGPVAALRGAKQ